MPGDKGVLDERVLDDRIVMGAAAIPEPERHWLATVGRLADLDSRPGGRLVIR